MKQNTIATIVFFLCYYSYSQTVYHVAVTGSDISGTGTLSNPYATLQKAANMVAAGDTVYVHQGTYTNSDFNDGDIWNGDNLVTITANGTASNYITFMPYPGDHVILEFDSTYCVLIKNASYVIFSGFEVKGIAKQINQTEADNAWGLYKDSGGVIHDLAGEMGIDINDPSLAGKDVAKPNTLNTDKPSYYNGRAIVANSSHHIVISNNIVRDVPSAAIRAQQSDYVIISNNTVFNNTYWTTQGVGAITVAEATPIDTNTGVKIELINNYVHHNENRLISWNPTKDFVKMEIDEGTGLFLTRNNSTYSNGKILIANNISSYNGASGIVCHYTDRVLIEHNTVYKNGTTNGSAAGGIGVNSSDIVTIRNNIAYAEPNHWALGILANPVTNTNITNNILYNENGSETIHRNMPNGWVKVNPLLVDPENEDFKLNSSSTAIDAGHIATTITDDFLGNPRNDGAPDIGAYEFQTALSTKEFETISELKVYPNPFNSQLTLLGSCDELNTVQIVNSLGQLVLTTSNTCSVDKVVLNLSNLKSGLYFIKSKTKTLKVVKL